MGSFFFGGGLRTTFFFTFTVWGGWWAFTLAGAGRWARTYFR